MLARMESGVQSELVRLAVGDGGGPEVWDCGVVPYVQALTLQEELCVRRQQGRISDVVLLVEHPAVITLGARTPENKLLVSREDLRGRGTEVVQIRRGGGTTAHNPGQAVIYPILKIKPLGLGVNEYVRGLEAVGVELLAGFGVTAQRRKGYPGLWVGERKIGSIGVQIKRGVTMHGMAINVNNDLAIFDAIVPCGIEGVVMTSVRMETGRDANLGEVKGRLADLAVRCWCGERAAR